MRHEELRKIRKYQVFTKFSLTNSLSGRLKLFGINLFSLSLLEKKNANAAWPAIYKLYANSGSGKNLGQLHGADFL